MDEHTEDWIPLGKEDYSRYRAEVVQLLGDLKPCLPADELKNIGAMLSADELVLAFESPGPGVIGAEPTLSLSKGERL